MESTFRFFRVRGIPVGAHWSWLLVFALVIWSLSASLFPATYPGLDGSAYLLMGLVAAALFFLSIVLHELGHTFVALAQGIRIRGISLWLFGGVARFETPFASPAAELRTAVGAECSSCRSTRCPRRRTRPAWTSTAQTPSRRRCGCSGQRPEPERSN
jgi:Zn-dependent protease